MRQVVLDTETTGLSPQHGHRLTEIGCIEIIDRKLRAQFHTYLNPEREVDAKAEEMTGLNWKKLKDKPKFAEKADELLEFIDGAELIIHNAPFDLGFLDHELSMMKHPWGHVSKKLDVIDTLTMAREMHPGQRNSLDALCKRYEIDNSHRSLHGALLDAEILAYVYLAMTAGQTDMDLMSQTVITTSPQTDNEFSRVAQGMGSNLKVIYANEQELSSHAAMLALIEKQKK